MLTLKTCDADHKTKTKPLEGKQKKKKQEAKFSIKKY
jgi:hypothetical protein